MKKKNDNIAKISIIKKISCGHLIDKFVKTFKNEKNRARGKLEEIFPNR